MSDRLCALLVHHHPEPFESLKQTLSELSIETCSVVTCKEAEDLISRRKPHIIFTDSSLPDGWWSKL